jgi:hypothetical protein
VNGDGSVCGVAGFMAAPFVGVFLTIHCSWQTLRLELLRELLEPLLEHVRSHQS